MNIQDNFGDKKKWNEFVLRNDGHVLQTWEYGEVRKAMGIELLRIAVMDASEIQTVAQLSVHDIPHVPFRVGYIPRGPVCSQHGDKTLPILFEHFKILAREYNLAFIKVEPNTPLTTTDLNTWQEILTSYGTQSSNPRFMNATSILDISKSEEELLNRCRKNTRYAIRKSERDGIQYITANDTRTLDTFYKLLAETADRQGFQLAARPQKYFELLQQHLDTHLYFALINDEPVAAVLNFYTDNTAYYPYGASSIKAHGTYATEGLLWYSVMQAKRAGKTAYDLWGVLPNEDKDHPYWGYTFFKNGFGGKLVEYIGSYDLPYTPLYRPLIWAEHLRRKLL